MLWTQSAAPFCQLLPQVVWILGCCLPGYEDTSLDMEALCRSRASLMLCLHVQVQLNGEGS